MTTKSTFSAHLEELISERGLSKAELARATYVDKKRIYNLTNNPDSDPPLSILVDLANFFSVPIDYLAGRTDSRTQIVIKPPPEPPRPHFFNKRWEGK